MKQTTGASSASRPRAFSSPGALLVILALMNFLNYVDRQIVGPLVVLLQQPVGEGGLALSSLQCGLLATAFMVVHAAASAPMGAMADRHARKRVIAVGVGLWSLATALAGFTRSFGQLFVARASVGIGEATYAPAASALISERFPAETRARALGIFQLGMVLGGAAGVILGGAVGGWWGWRAAFFVVGIPGLALAALVLLLPAERRPRDPSRAAASASLIMEARALTRSPAVLWVNVAGMLVTFFTGALVFWGPKFILTQHYGGNTHMLQRASLIFGMIAIPASVAGTLWGSFLADRLESRRPGEGRLLVIAIGSFATVPFAAVGFYAQPAWLLFGSLAIGVFFSVWYVGPILAALHDVVPVGRRGTATGVYFLLIHLFGDAISPPIVGWIGDRVGSLRTGLLVATCVLFTGGIAALLARPESRRIAEGKRVAQGRQAAAT